MARWLNRMKYKGRSPVLAGATSGPNKKMIYNGLDIHEYIPQSGPGDEGLWIRSQVLNDTFTQTNYIVLPFSPNKYLKMRIKFKPLVGTGGQYVGTLEIPDDKDWRMFVYGDKELMFDNGNYRIGTYNTHDYPPRFVEFGDTLDMTFGHFYYKDNTTGQIWGPNTPIPQATVDYSLTMILSVQAMALNMIQFWDGNDNLIFDAYVAMDNGEGAIWDNVTQQYYHFPEAVVVTQS